MTRICVWAVGFVVGCGAAVRASEPIDLSGTWRFTLGEPADATTYAPPESSLKIPSQFDDSIRLPGTTDTNHKGQRVEGSTKGTYTRRFRHVGRAWYQRTITIPANWQNSEVELFLERALWKTTVYVDGQPIGNNDSLATPHVYNLGRLAPGKHLLTICVDNSMIHNIGDKSHSYSENMQTIWNGLLGRLELHRLPPVRIKAVRTQIKTAGKKDGSNQDHGSLLLRVENESNKRLSAQVTVSLKPKPVGGASSSANTPSAKTWSSTVALEPGMQTVVCPLPEGLALWDEFHRNLYDAEIVVRAGSESNRWRGELGFCQPGSDGTHVTINGRAVFLRGNLDNCHFPLTGHPPMDKAGWLRIWKIYRQFGLNHVRFHSWCPPEAAFAAADEVGIYIQAEAGVWIDGWMKGRVASKPDGISDQNRDVRDFVVREMHRIIDAYGHHPSFVMFCIGNELGSSDFKVLGNLIEETRQYDGTSRLYSCSTARALQPKIDDFFISHKNPAGGMRGLRGPKTNWDFDGVKRGAPHTPMILHELGQWPISPDWREIEKYTGVVEARNLMAMKEKAVSKHLAAHDRAFQQSTGQFSVLLYKAEMEAALRSKTYAGFHLLGLQDYMGQGEAMIGILDMFYDLKPGIIAPEVYRRFCQSVVPLAGFEKYVWTSGETFSASLHISNFSDADVTKAIRWELAAKNGTVLGQGHIDKTCARSAVTDLGDIHVPLDTTTPLACTLKLTVEQTLYRNDWPLWVFPATPVVDPPEDLLVAKNLDDASLAALEAGRSVLLMGNACLGANVSRDNRFMPVYWSMGWFPGQKKTLGLLCDPKHPLFRLFPTENHCDWQWWSVVNPSKVMILNDLPADFRPIAEPVDDFHRSDRLGTILETRVGSGKLLICLYPLRQRLDDPACRQLYAALIDYAGSSDFQPQTELPIEWLKANFKPVPRTKTTAKSPIDSAPAALWVQVADKMKASGRNVRYSPSLDRIKEQKVGYQYELQGDGAWKDEGGCVVFGKKVRLRIALPKGVEGTLFVRFNDWNQNDRDGQVAFENRSSALGAHAQRDGHWVEFNVMREDALDERLQLDATVTSGPNLQIDEFLFVPK